MVNVMDLLKLVVPPRGYDLIAAELDVNNGDIICKFARLAISEKRKLRPQKTQPPKLEGPKKKRVPEPTPEDEYNVIDDQLDDLPFPEDI